METNFFIFRERLAIACRLRGITYDQLCSSIGLGGRRNVDLEYAGSRALDIYRLAQIADRLDVSIDWLLGRSKAMELREKQCQGKSGNAVPNPPRRLLTSILIALNDAIAAALQMLTMAACTRLAS